MAIPVVYVLVAIYTGAALVATILLLRRIHRWWHLFQGLPYEPIDDPYKPAPIEKTRSVTALGVIAVIWSLSHVVCVGVWATTGVGPARSGSMGFLAVCVTLVATIDGVGAILLLRCVPFGRRMLSWANFLSAMGGIVGSLMMLLAWQHAKTPAEIRVVAVPLAIGLAMYAVLAALIGSLAGRVGAPRGETPAHEERIEPVERIEPIGGVMDFGESDLLDH